MIDIERRALLGDKQAQEECTRQGIVLPCPFCGGEAMIEYDDIMPFEYSVFCGDCGVTPSTSEDKQVAISVWNTRIAPLVGRCGECANACKALSELKSFCESKADAWKESRDAYAAGVRDAMETVCAWLDNAQAGEDVHD